MWVTGTLLTRVYAAMLATLRGCTYRKLRVNTLQLRPLVLQVFCSKALVNNNYGLMVAVEERL